MTDPHKSPAAPTDPVADAADPAMTADAGAEMIDPSAGEALIQTLEAEKADLTDRLLRAHADMQNLRRRTEKEVADARAYAVTKFARDMLDVCDNLRRGLEAVPADERAQADAAFKALIEGVELTERDMLKKLEAHGVKRLSPEGERFDPNFHQAMFEADDPAKPNGTVIAVMQVGYSIGERVLRPALVGVSRGGPKATPASPAPAGEQSPQ